jgi:23S rRNA (adenine2503-C2)-methyltransferase
MKILSKAGQEEIALVYVAETADGQLVEFVESVSPPLPREKKWVLIISTLYGCPIGCKICDAGSHYQGPISRADMMSQIDYLITKRYPGQRVPIEKFKIQFARMGEPAFNEDVIEVLEDLHLLYDAPGLIPCISTVAPEGCQRFFSRLLEIKKRIYKDRFQLQFSIHTTDLSQREWLMPVRKWDFEKIGQYGEDFYEYGDRKITLNFALVKDAPIDPGVLRRYFRPDIFLIKITPTNPTHQALKNNVQSHIQSDKQNYEVIEKLRQEGYEVILSIGEYTENQIGSNCGQYITNYQKENFKIENSYTYPLEKV